MNVNDIVIRFITDGADHVRGAFDSSSQAARGFNETLNKVDAESALAKTESKTKQLNESLTALGNNDGVPSATSKVGGFLESVHKARQETEGLRQTAEEITMVGAGFAIAGAGGIMLSNSLIQVYEEGERASGALESMFQKRGEGGRVEELQQWASELSMTAAMVDDDPIKEAAAQMAGFGLKADDVKSIMPGLIGQSRLYNQSLESTAMAFGKAFAKGDVGALTKSGVTLDEGDIEKLKNISDITERQKMLVEMVKKSMSEYALSITEGMSESEMAANRLKNSMDGIQGSIGKGSADAQRNIDGITTSVVALVSNNPDLAYGAGQFLTYGSHAMTAVGGLVTLTGSLGQAYIGAQAFSKARMSTAAATNVATAAETLNTAALTQNAAATVAETAAESANTVTTSQNAAATNAATVAENLNTIAATENAVATTAAGTAAGGAAVRVGVLGQASMIASMQMKGASLGMLGLVAGIGVAVGVVLAGGLYKLGQFLGLLDESRSMLADLQTGWTKLTQGTQEAEAQIGDKMYKDAMKATKVQAAKMRDEGKTEEEIGKYTTARDAYVENNFAKQFKGHGDEDRYAEHSERFGRIRQMQESQASVPASALAVPAEVAAPPVADAASEVEAIQAKIDAATLAGDKDGKKLLAIQLRNAKAAERTQAKGAKRNDQLESYQAQLEVAKLEADAAQKVTQLESQMNGANDENIKRQIARILAQKEIQASAINARALGDDDPEKAGILQQIAQLKAGSSVASADADAAKSGASAREKLLQKQQRAFSEVALARLEADTDVAIARLEAQKGKGGNRDIDYRIEQLRAEKEVRQAQIRAKADPETSGSSVEIASIRANSMLAEAAIARDKSGNEGGGGLAAALERLRNGGSIFDKDSGTSSTRSDSSSSKGASSPQEYTVRIGNTQKTEANGDTRVKFLIDDLIIKRSPLERAFVR